MHFFNRSRKKAEIARLLSSHDPMTTTKIESSAIAQVALMGLPVSIGNFGILAMFVICLFGFSFYLLLNGRSTDNQAILTMATLGIAGSVIGVFILLAKVYSDKKRLTHGLQAAFSELKQLTQHLESYLETIDKRTNRFFHCVTTSKVTTYYLLNQIQSALSKSVEELERLINSYSVSSLAKALDRLQGSFLVSDGLLAESGQQHEIYYYNVRMVLAELEQKMELGIHEIEQEIISFKNPPR